NTYSVDDEYMFGSDLLLAPVLREGATTRSFYLPKGGWVEVATGRRFEGARSHTIPVTMESIPLFVKAGAFMFRQPVVQYTGQMRGQPLIVEVYGGGSGNRSLFEDDGLSFKFEQGQSMTRRFTQERSGNSVKVSAAAGEGQWHPAARQIRFVVQVDHEPSRVTVNGTNVPPARPRSAGPHPSPPPH